MNICLLSTALSCHRQGGIETHADLLAAGAAAAGHKVTMVSASHPVGLAEEEKNGIKRIYLPGTSHMMSRKDASAWWPAAAGKIRELAASGSADIVWAENVSGQEYAACRARSGGPPVISIMHGPGIIGDLGSKWRAVSGAAEIAAFFSLRVPQALLSYRPWIRNALLRSDAVAAVSSYARESLLSEFPAARERVRVIYNGIETGIFRPDQRRRELTRTSLNIPGEDTIVIMAGVLSRQKGFHLGLRAFERALSSAPAARLVIAGDGPEKAELEGMAARMGLSDKVIFYGGYSRERLPALLAAADIFLNPTLRAEGLPLAVLEAMSSGLACVLSPMGGAAETAVHGKSAIFTDPEDADRTGRALASLMTDREPRRKLGRAAREKAVKDFDFMRMAGDYLSLSRELAGKPG